MTEEQAETSLRTLVPGPDGARLYRDAFPAAGPEQLYGLVNADWLFRLPALHLTQALAAGGGRTHLCELTWPAPGPHTGMKPQKPSGQASIPRGRIADADGGLVGRPSGRGNLSEPPTHPRVGGR